MNEIARSILTSMRHNLVAWLALFVALGGTSLAASHYIITSTKQIKPSVLKTLRGEVPRGPAGPPGPNGLPGISGATGPEGEKGATGTPGASGRLGPEGPEGLPGTEGASGTTVVARARSVASMKTTTAPEPNKEIAITVDPLSGGTWTQGAGELNELVGQVTATEPPVAQCSDAGGAGSAVIEIKLDGDTAAFANARNEGVNTETTKAVEISWKASPADWLFEPGADTPHTLTAKVGDDCGWGGGNTGGHFTLESIKIDVLGAH